MGWVLPQRIFPTTYCTVAVFLDHGGAAGVGPAAARRGVWMAACRLLRGRIITLCPALQISQPTEPNRGPV